MKRVADVLQSPEHCKRVLREICILRRLRHPNLIGIRDAFVRPSATGQCRLVKGKLVNLSVDVYIAMELADGGDLFHTRGQMSADEVKSLMWQLLVTLKFLHSMHVWHRDMKSQNVFLVWEAGERVIKIGDFGSARSALPEGYHWAEQGPPTRKDAAEEAQRGSRGQLAVLHPADSYEQMNEAMEPGDLYLQHEGGSGSKGGGKPGGYKAPLTRVVATPCYRAPEVVMSRGGYTAAIDMWSLGCIFGELLQRIAHVGSATTPNLQVAPLFAISGLPKTPEDGETFLGSPGNEMTRSELQALFAVIGTPCWADVAAVQEPSWRRYLHHLPGRAPTLYRRFSAAGEAAVDLLSRLLAFDPTRRCSPDEALVHEYFADMSMMSEGGSHEDLLTGQARRRSMGHMPLADPSSVPFPEPQTPVSLLQPYQPAKAPTEMDVVCEEEAAAGTAGGAAAPAGPTPSSLSGPFASVLQVSSDSVGEVVSGSTEAAAGEAGRPARRAYWEEDDPGRALAMLEDELSEITGTGCNLSPQDEGFQKMRRMLETECEAIRATQGRPAGAAGAAGEPPGTGGKKRARVLHTTPGSDQSIAACLLKGRGGLQVDMAAQAGDADRYGRERLSNVADTGLGRELDPSRILGPQRHGEWFRQQAGQGPRPGPAWGVTALPPGMDPSDPKARAIMRAQQGR